ncbi:MAG: T9SS type A sorting domain-containing protein, partial [Bacteroidia bacterium]|nr:T9SS type A sorting domain-containing protein [Bacteroidia bacterium]
FWYTTEYYASTSSSNWRTRIGSFTFDNVFSTAASATPTKFCLGIDTVQSNVLAWGGSSSYTYSWTSVPSGFTSTQQNPTVVPTDTTQYMVATNDGTQTRNDTVLVKVVYPPEANAGNDTVICSWVDGLDLHGEIAYYRSFVWGSFGDGTFSDMYSLETTYYPGSGDRSAGGVNLVLVVFAQSPCLGRVMDTLALVIDPCTGIDNLSRNSLKLSIRPNPAREKVVLLVTGSQESACMLSLTGVDGRVFHSQTLNTEQGRAETALDISGYTKGIYFIQVKTASGMVTERLVIQ